MSSNSAPRGVARFLPAGRAWWLVGGAVLAGLLLFALVLSSKRDEFEFYRAQGGEASGVPGQVFEPLPEPLPAGESAASGMDTQAPEPTQPQAPAREPARAAAATGVAGAGAGPAAQGASAVAGSSAPRPLSTPEPAYPAAALRAGASGEVVLRIEVGADGRPADVTVVSGSGNRALDRAAVRAVRRWRFEPAMRDGVPTTGTVQQPIRFSPPR